MADFSIHAYDADVWIPSFAGLRQSEEVGFDLRYAAEAENAETPNGVLQPQAAPEVMKGSFEKKIETLARFHRRWYDGAGSKEWLVCACDGQLYCRQVNDTRGWVQIELPLTIGSFDCNVWSWVTYETNLYGVDHPVDVLLMSNAEDGMIMVIPPDRPTTWRDLMETTWGELKTKTWDELLSPKWNVQRVTTGDYKFGVIERYAERIWGGAVAGEPDLLVYSAPYNPIDWEANQETPEDGAGEISQPSWDGGSFTALKAFGSHLLAFKGNRVWSIVGTDPGQYVFNEQFGGGTLYPNTIADNVERVLMVEKDGLSVYDGLSVSPFQRKAIENVWRRVNVSAMDQMCAALIKNRYYLAVPMDDSTVNNALIVYNIEEGTFLLDTDIYVESMLATDETLYATTSTEPGKVHILHYNSWETGSASGKRLRWETPWIDFGRKNIAKGGYEIYFSPEVKGSPVTFRFSIQTEKKTKSKDVIVQTTTFKAKQKRIRFGGTGRRFKLIIETVNQPQNAVWRLTGGIQMVVETDPD